MNLLHAVSKVTFVFRLVLLLSLMSALVHGIQLGDPQVNSTRGNPLNVAIPLLEIPDSYAPNSLPLQISKARLVSSRKQVLIRANTIYDRELGHIVLVTTSHPVLGNNVRFQLKAGEAEHNYLLVIPDAGDLVARPVASRPVSGSGVGSGAGAGSGGQVVKSEPSAKTSKVTESTQLTHVIKRYVAIPGYENPDTGELVSSYSTPGKINYDTVLSSTDKLLRDDVAEPTPASQRTSSLAPNTGEASNMDKELVLAMEDLRRADNLLKNTNAGMSVPVARPRPMRTPSAPRASPRPAEEAGASNARAARRVDGEIKTMLNELLERTGRLEDEMSGLRGYAERQQLVLDELADGFEVQREQLNSMETRMTRAMESLGGGQGVMGWIVNTGFILVLLSVLVLLAIRSRPYIMGLQEGVANLQTAQAAPAPAPAVATPSKASPPPQEPDKEKPSAQTKRKSAASATPKASASGAKSSTAKVKAQVETALKVMTGAISIGNMAAAERALKIIEELGTPAQVKKAKTLLQNSENK